MAEDIEALEDGFLGLYKALERLPAIKQVDIHGEPSLNRFGPEALMSVRTADGTRNLQVELKSSGEPRFIREAAFRLGDWIRNKKDESYGIVIAPFISPDSRDILRKEHLGWFDLAGNCLISFDGIHLEISKSDLNPFSQKRKQRSLFSPKSGRVLRLLLTESGPWKGTDLVSRTKVSAGQISKIREGLLDREWASTSSEGLRITQPTAILEAWRDSLTSPPKIIAQGYTIAHGKALDARLQMLFGKTAITQYATVLLAAHSVARRVAPYVRATGEYFYADKKGIELIQEILQLENGEAGANVTIFQPDDELLSLDSILLQPVPLRGTSLIQTYLDLSVMGERSGEGADHLYKEKIEPHLLVKDE